MAANEPTYEQVLESSAHGRHHELPCSCVSGWPAAAQAPRGHRRELPRELMHGWPAAEALHGCPAARALQGSTRKLLHSYTVAGSSSSLSSSCVGGRRQRSLVGRGARRRARSAGRGEGWAHGKQIDTEWRGIGIFHERGSGDG